MDDYTWDVEEIMGLHDPERKENDIITLSKEDIKKIKEKLHDIEYLYEDVVSDNNSKDEEIEDLQNRIDDSCYDYIPSEIGSLFVNNNYDLGTVIELKEKIEEILKKHGYNAG
jgi:archaellum component FlaC